MMPSSYQRSRLLEPASLIPMVRLRFAKAMLPWMQDALAALKQSRAARRM